MFGYPEPTIQKGYENLFLTDLYSYLKARDKRFIIEVSRSRESIFSFEGLNIDRFSKNVARHADAPYMEESELGKIRSKSMSQNLRTARNKLQDKDWEFQSLSCSLLGTNSRELEMALDSLVELHKARWPNSIFKIENEGFKSYIWSLINNPIDDTFKIYVIKIENKIEAIAVGAILERKFYYLINAHNAHMPNSYSLGHLLISEIVAFHKLDLDSFDFINDKEDYKFRWTNRIGTRFFITLNNPRILNESIRDFYPSSIYGMLRTKLSTSAIIRIMKLNKLKNMIDNWIKK